LKGDGDSVASLGTMSACGTGKPAWRSRAQLDALPSTRAWSAASGVSSVLNVPTSTISMFAPSPHPTRQGLRGWCVGGIGGSIRRPGLPVGEPRRDERG
jgi:hypothetical protein